MKRRNFMKLFVGLPFIGVFTNVFAEKATGKLPEGFKADPSLTRNEAWYLKTEPSGGYFVRGDIAEKIRSKGNLNEESSAAKKWKSKGWERVNEKT